MSTFHVVQEGPINALALNRDYTQVAIAGRNGMGNEKLLHIR